MNITTENYYSSEADMEYMSVSQLKGFMMCEARQMAILSGEYIYPDTTALLQGRLLEILLLEPDKMEQFKQDNPEMFSQRLDIYQPQSCIVDLKGVKDFMPIWDSNAGKKMNFIEYWGYDKQLAVYQWLIYQNNNELLPVFIAGITKENVADIGIFQVPQEHLDNKLSEIAQLAKRYQQIKDSKIEPIRCECCDYCKATKKLNTVINLFE